MYREINRCRICGNQNIIDILDLGNQSLTGIFQSNNVDKIDKSPLVLSQCSKHSSSVCNPCGLVQLKHTYSLEAMYGDTYGYRSSLNKSMVDHLNKKVDNISDFVELNIDDLVLDIGSNDGTLLSFYDKSLTRVGIDPTSEKYAEFYDPEIVRSSEFFSADNFKRIVGNRKAKVITSISMFYDLEEPLKFVSEISECLHEDGIWECEQSYLLSMLETNSYDTICHEHLEYYTIEVLDYMCQLTGLEIIFIEFNDINGGSFSAKIAHKKSKFVPHPIVAIALQKEKLYFSKPNIVMKNFSDLVFQSKEKILDYFNENYSSGRITAGLGASTKGNVLLQFCEISTKQLPMIFEVNSDKYGKYTPGSNIPIYPESELINHSIDDLFVLPWHFKSFFLKVKRLRKYNLVFPLPVLHKVKKS